MMKRGKKLEFIEKSHTVFINFGLIIAILAVLIILACILYKDFSKNKGKVIADCELNAQNKLEIITDIQRRFKSMKKKDNNGNEEGEYGNIKDLIKEQEWQKHIFFGNSLKKGKDFYISDWGYNYCIYLPKAINLQEKYWVCYAWPTKSSIFERIKTTFVVDQDGIVYGCNTKKYIGEMAPTPEVAFLRGNGTKKVFGLQKNGNPTNDEENWYFIKKFGTYYKRK